MAQEFDSHQLRDGEHPDPADLNSHASPENLEEPRPRSRRRRWRTRLIVLVGALVLIAGGLAVWRYLSSYESTDDAQVDAHLHPVSARISGHVIRVNVGDNEFVKQGAVLVEIDPTDYQVAVDNAKADLATAQATADSLHIDVPITTTTTSSQLDSTAADVQKNQAAVAVAEKQLAAARAQLDQAQANDVKAQHDLRRYQLLVDEEEVSRQIYDTAVAAAKASTATVSAAAANVEAVRQSVEQARSVLASAEATHRGAQTAPKQIASSKARALSAQATVDQKRAALEQAKLNLLYTRVIAPVAGSVTKTVVPGLNVQPGQQMLTIVPLDDVWITANFKETQLRHIRPGLRADVYVDSTGRTYHGHVDSIAGATGPLFSLFPPENATGNYVKIVQRIPTKIVIDPGQNRDRLLRPGVNVAP
ncbi:MAG TPA: HlyD family secretion protein, partial [Vicinamibacterales bacterium]|nr:HlyD family secretion protein [Vicinamibacterales bacterium]